MIPCKQYWKVAVNVPLRKLFTYQCPENLYLKPGDLVKVPFGAGNKKLTGLIVEESFAETQFQNLPESPGQPNLLKKKAEHLTEKQVTDRQINQKQKTKIKEILEKDREKPSLSRKNSNG